MKIRKKTSLVVNKKYLYQGSQIERSKIHKHFFEGSLTRKMLFHINAGTEKDPKNSRFQRFMSQVLTES